MRGRVRAATVLAILALAAPMPVAVPATVAVEATTLTITSVPVHPVANTVHRFTALATPAVAGRTVRWDIGGVPAGTSLTASDGTASFEITLGPGGHSIQIYLVGGPDWEWAYGGWASVWTDPDPAMLPDSFSFQRYGFSSFGASGPAASIWVDRQYDTPTFTAVDGSSGESVSIFFVSLASATAGEAAFYITARPYVCGSPYTAGARILSLRRDESGAVLGITFTYWLQCERWWRPMVGWVRVNDTTPVPALGLPVGEPRLGSVVPGSTGEPVTWSIPNIGELPVPIGRLAVSGPAATDFELSDDTCSGTTLAPGAACSVQLRLVPTTTGDRWAALEVPGDLPLRFTVVGYGRIPTAIGMPTARADETSYADGVRYQAVITPDPGYDSAACLIDGIPLAAGSPSGGLLRCLGHRPPPGTHTLQVTWPGGVSHAGSASPVRTFVVDPSTTTTITVDRSGPVAANVPVRISARVGFRGDIRYSAGILTVRDASTGEVLAAGAVGPESPSISVTRTLAAGRHTLLAEYAGIEGAQEPSSDSVDLVVDPPDLAAPTVTAPSARLFVGSVVSIDEVPIRLAWSGSDRGSWITGYALRVAETGLPWLSITGPFTAPSADLWLPAGWDRRFGVRARDAAGNWSDWAVSPIVRPEMASDRDAAVRYAGAWGFSRSSAWWGGTARWSSTAGATASYTFTGRSVGLVSLRGPGRGLARIYVDGTAVATVDLGAAATSARRVVWVGRWPTTATRRVTVRVLGTAGRPRVDLDGFVVLR